MMKLTRSGYLIENCPQEVKKELTVRAEVNKEFAFPPPPFKVFKASKKKSTTVCVPRFYGIEKFGHPKEDTRPEPSKLNTNIKFNGKLRNETHQIEAFTKGISTGNGVLSLPCGYGKTTIALAIACRLGLRTMIIVHKEFLANQWRERIQQFCPGATVGIVQQNKIQVECDFVIAMLQSLSMKEYSFDIFESIGTLFVDEAHHICAQVFSQGLFKLCPRHCYGLSATPIRKDGLTKILHWFLGPTFLVIERQNQEQVEVNVVPYICSEYNEIPPCNRMGKISLPTMVTYLVNDKIRTKTITDLINKIVTEHPTRKLLILSERRLHCEEMYNFFPGMSGLYMGGMKEKELEESSEKQIIFGTFSQAHEGLDIPTLDTVILATPRSDIKQAIGRIMRETTGKKNNPLICDVWDQWSVFNAMYRKRIKVYKQGGFKIHSEKEEKEEEKTTFSFI
jgi:superfamily II DNA or RNA helicase